MANNVSAYLEEGVKSVFVETLADMKAPKVSELTGVGATELSYYIVPDGWKPTRSQDSIDDGREGTATVGKILGPKKFDNGEVEVIDNVNRKDADNAAVETLTEGTQGYIVRRRGPEASVDWAAGDVVSVYKVAIGMKNPVAHASNARQTSTISFAIDPSSLIETATVAAGA